jgi:penicillin-binding protein 1A
LGYVAPEAAAAAKKEPLKLASIEVSEAPYFVEYVRRQLEERYGSNAVYKSGLKVFTSLDLPLQHMAQDAVNEGLAEAEKIINPNIHTLPGRKAEPLQCALVMLEPSSGEIKAMIGGRNFAESKFNRAIQAQRQPGSSFKPFIYATAFTQGFTQADIILDTPVVCRDDRGNAWKPENFSNKFYGPTTLRTALTHSRNVPTVKLLSKIGAPNVIELAHKLGIKSVLKPYLTLALGAFEVNLLELTSAMSTFPNKGVHSEPLSILRVEDFNGQVLEENTPAHQEVLDEATSAIMTDVLENVVNHGTGIVARQLGFQHPAGGKTGTTNDFSDAWFIGFTSEYTAGVWMGLDSHRSMGKGITGGMVACPVWTKLMMKIYAQRAPRHFTLPENVELVDFCNVSGLLPNPGCAKNVQTGAFAIGTAPSQHCDVHLEAGSGVPAYHQSQSPDLVDLDNNTGTGKANTQKTAPAANPNSDRPPLF